MQPCPCGLGKRIGVLKASEGAIPEKKPVILCNECADIFEYRWYLNWCPLRGSYWYGFKAQIRS